MAEIAIPAAITLVDMVVSYVMYANDRRKAQRHQRKEGHSFDSIREWLETMQAYLKDAEGKTPVTEGLKDRMKQVRDRAFEIEDAIEEFMLEVPEHFHEHKITQRLHDLFHSGNNKKSLCRLNSRMEKIYARIQQITDLDKFRLLPPELKASSSGGGEVPVPVFYPKVMDEELVGIEKRKVELLNLISNRESGQMVISVVGPRGSGKTTLIKEVYENLKDDFDCHAWISAPHPIQQIPDKIWAEMKLPVSQGAVASEGLHSYLQRKRYLVVLDGLWKKDDWNYIHSVLPNSCNGSKTIVSTHKHDVASHCAHLCNTYHLNALSWGEGWELFCTKTFGEKKCPKHLVDCSERIVKRCEGLPLAIVATASLLSNKPQTTAEFEKLHNSLGHELGGNDHLSIVGKISLQSYYHLSYHLRCCFLYFCNFPEDYSIRRGRLVRLWIAEKFVEEGGNSKTLEDMANEYLNQLIQMHLVEVSERDLQGRVRNCRVVNLVREFILSKSENDNFCRVFSRSNKSLSGQPRRLSLHDRCNNSFQMADVSCVRTLMTFARDSDINSMAGKPLDSFRFLRVLGLEGAALESFPEEVLKLTLLRYLSLRNTKIKTVPKAVKKLQSLLTLDLRQTHIEKLPKSVRKLRNLLYLLVDKRDVNQARVGAEMPPRIGNLASLQKLSLVKASKIVRELENLVELRKLGITGLAKENGMDLCASIQKMEHLTSLHVTSTKEELLDLDALGKPPQYLCDLYLEGRLQNIPQWISSAHSLVKVCLKGSKLMYSPLKAIQTLPSLLELQLVDAYTGEELEFEARCFQKLMILEIEQFDALHKIVWGKEALPELQKVVLRRCKNLKKAPSGIHRLIKLEEILLYDMPQQLFAELHETIGNKRQSRAHHVQVRCFCSST